MKKEGVVRHTHEAIIPVPHADSQDATKSECLLMVNIIIKIQHLALYLCKRIDDLDQNKVCQVHFIMGLQIVREKIPDQKLF